MVSVNVKGMTLDEISPVEKGRTPVKTIDPEAPATIPIPSPPARPRSLWKIAEDLTVLEDLIEENEGEITGCEAIVDQWFAELGDEAKRKLDGYAGFITELIARSEARKEEADRMAHRAKVDANLAAFLKQRMLEFFRLRNWTKLETLRYKIGRQANGGLVPLQITIDAERLPAEFRVEKITYSANNKLIREALEAGESLDFARLGERGEQIRIR